MDREGAAAAAIRSTGAIGIAVGLGRIEIAITLAIVNFLGLKVIGQVKKDSNCRP